ncbi:MAG: YybH family protein [Ginsengibacter sp.]
MLVKRICGTLFLIIAFLASSCSQQDKMEIEKSASSFDLKQGEASVLQSNRHFIKSYKAHDSAAIAQAFTKNAKVMVANHEPVEGRNDIGEYFSGMIKSGISDIQLNTEKIWGDSSILVEEGKFALFDQKGDQADKGEYIALWQRESGNWKVYRDMWTSIQPKSVLNISDSALIKH